MAHVRVKFAHKQENRSTFSKIAQLQALIAHFCTKSLKKIKKSLMPSDFTVPPFHSDHLLNEKNKSIYVKQI